MGWRVEAEAASSSGGHILPEPALFDQRRPAAPAAPTPKVEDRPRIDRRPTPIPRPAPMRRQRRMGGRRVQRTIKHVDVWSVFKLSIFYYACFTILWLLLVAVLYFFLARAGLFHAIERFGKAMVLWNHVNISLLYVEKWALLLALAFLIIGSLINAVIAFLYNLAADVVGGVELTFIEKDVGRSQSSRLQPDYTEPPLDENFQE